ncbi:MAG: glycine cleavage system aminomethyltransferase GcvT [Lachnospiraceae bacterium]
MDRKTALYENHMIHKGQMVPFAGYLLPIQYESGIKEEHLAVRNGAGLFDVSHMGEIKFSGQDALSNLQYLFTNDFADMKDGRARYSLMCNESGGILDDLIVYKRNDEDYLVVVNAANRGKDYKWIMDHRFGNVQIEDRSDEISQIALQGPKALEILSRIAPESSIPKSYYTAIFDAKIRDIDCVVAKTGYTGEDGVEIYIANQDAVKLWELLLEAGSDFQIQPCGLGARDTLRLEAAMPLYGHEMDETTTPFEAGLGFAVKLQKENFIGKAALEAAEVPTSIRVGLKITGRGIVREMEEIYIGEDQIGHTTSGTYCPYLGYPVAMAKIRKEYAELGNKVEVNVRGRRVEAVVTELPFYNKKNR